MGGCRDKQRRRGVSELSVNLLTAETCAHTYASHAWWAAALRVCTCVVEEAVAVVVVLGSRGHQGTKLETMCVGGSSEQIFTGL